MNERKTRIPHIPVCNCESNMSHPALESWFCPVHGRVTMPAPNRVHDKNIVPPPDPAGKAAYESQNRPKRKGKKE